MKGNRYGAKPAGEVRHNHIYIGLTDREKSRAVEGAGDRSLAEWFRDSMEITK